MRKESEQDINRRAIEFQIVAWLIDDFATSSASRDTLAALSAEDFSDGVAQRAFETIKRHATEGTQFNAEIIQAETNGFVPASELNDIILKLGTGIPSIHLPPLVKTLKNYVLESKAKSVFESALSSIGSGQEPSQIIASAQTRLNEIATDSKIRVRNAKIARLEQVEDFEAMNAGTFTEKPRVSLTIPPLDRLLKGGIASGQLAILAARPGGGKTAFAVHVVANILTQGKKVLFSSLEMGDREILDRLSACLTGAPTPHNLKEWNELKVIPHFQEAVSELLNPESFANFSSRLRFVDNAPYEEFFNTVKLAFARERFDVFVLDYIQLLRGIPNEGLRETVVRVSGGLKTLARELEIPVLALAQLNRDSSKEARKPRITDLKESGSIEQDADIVLLLSDDSDPNSPDLIHKNKLPRLLELAKNRHGGTGACKLSFDAPRFRFSERHES